MYEKYSVLFVDDEVNILNTFRRGLDDEGYNCLFANSGREALKIMEENEVHVIVTDMKMPEMTGLELLNQVKNQYPRVVKIVLSGYTQLPQILTTINQVDIFKFLTKPWILKDLSAIIKKALDYYILQEENLEYQRLLEMKNTSYQNILKRMNAIVADAKNRSKILGACGKVIYGFQKRYTLRDRIKFQKIFSLEEEIFELISNAVVDDKKMHSAKELETACIEAIANFFLDTNLEKADGIAGDFQINLDMFKAAILIVLLIFEDEFRSSGIVAHVKCENKFKYSIIAPKIQIVEEQDVDELTHLDVKMDFVQCVISEILEIIPMSFQILIADGSLVIGFSINRHEIETVKE